MHGCYKGMTVGSVGGTGDDVACVRGSNGDWVNFLLGVRWWRWHRIAESESSVRYQLRIKQEEYEKERDGRCEKHQAKEGQTFREQNLIWQPPRIDPLSIPRLLVQDHPHQRSGINVAHPRAINPTPPNHPHRASLCRSFANARPWPISALSIILVEPLYKPPNTKPPPTNPRNVNPLGRPKEGDEREIKATKVAAARCAHACLMRAMGSGQRIERVVLRGGIFVQNNLEY